MLEKSKPKVKLPPLPFGNEGAVLRTDIAEFGQRMASVITSLNEYAAVGSNSDFASKAVTLQINGVKLVASANTAVVADIGSSEDITLMIPFAGTNVSKIGSVDFRWQAGQGAMFIPQVGRGGVCGTRASLMVDLDPCRLQRTARAMLGYGEVAEIDMRLHEARVLKLRTPYNDFDGIFRNLCGIVDNVRSDADVLAKLGVDEMLYRAIVMMLRPDLFEAPETVQTSQDRCRELDAVCDFIRGNLGERITLTDLEKIAGTSARILQYAFQQRFGCTPMQWVREERLLMARRTLQKFREGDSISDAALRYGFMNQSAFSAYYKHRFGELPSETVAKRAKR
ncbi:MAG: AraC family transcriptional regulator [Rhodoferax sp.]|nr:AraC family transcriptional regulator [Rhodoferax sp.]MCF8209792.1 AraC family transcriptional regulator [Rhodoferax sp.]